MRARLPADADAVADGAAGWAALPAGCAAARGLGTLAARCVGGAGSGRPSMAEVGALSFGARPRPACCADNRPRGQVLAELERLCGAAAPPPALAERAECVVCMAAPRGTRLRPCCHVLLCAPCAAELVRRGDGCPACRAAVERYEEGAFHATYAPA